MSEKRLLIVDNATFDKISEQRLKMADDSTLLFLRFMRRCSVSDKAAPKSENGATS